MTKLCWRKYSLHGIRVHSLQMKNSINMKIIPFRMDLHGMTVLMAWERLELWIKQQHLLMILSKNKTKKMKILICIKKYSSTHFTPFIWPLMHKEGCSILLVIYHYFFWWVWCLVLQIQLFTFLKLLMDFLSYRLSLL